MHDWCFKRLSSCFTVQLAPPAWLNSMTQPLTRHTHEAANLHAPPDPGYLSPSLCSCCTGSSTTATGCPTPKDDQQANRPRLLGLVLGEKPMRGWQRCKCDYLCNAYQVNSVQDRRSAATQQPTVLELLLQSPMHHVSTVMQNEVKLVFERVYIVSNTKYFVTFLAIIYSLEVHRPIAGKLHV